MLINPDGIPDILCLRRSEAPRDSISGIGNFFTNHASVPSPHRIPFEKTSAVNACACEGIIFFSTTTSFCTIILLPYLQKAIYLQRNRNKSKPKKRGR
jgi:hypothetical protein